MGSEGAALLRQAAHGRVVARDEVAHQLEAIGDVVFGLTQLLVAREAQRSQVGAQLRQRFLVQKARQVVRAVEEDFRLAHAAEQRVVLGLRAGQRAAAQPRWPLAAMA